MCCQMILMLSWLQRKIEEEIVISETLLEKWAERYTDALLCQCEYLVG